MTDHHPPVIRDEYEGVGDGETTTFSWETGVPDPDDIQYVYLKETSESSPRDYYRLIDGTRIGVEYATPPEDREVFSVEWAVNEELPPPSDYSDQETNADRSMLDRLKRWLHI